MPATTQIAKPPEEMPCESLALAEYRFGGAVSKLSAGVMRIFIEHEGDEAENLRLLQAARAYEDLVRNITESISCDPSFDKHDARNFIIRCWKHMSVDLGIRYGENKFGFVSESLESKEFDCDTSAFLAFDVAKELGIARVQIVSVSEHALLKVGPLYFETTSGEFYNGSKFGKRYSTVYSRADTPVAAQVASLNSRGIWLCKHGRTDEAIEKFEKAIAYDPRNAYAYINRGTAYFMLGRYKDSIESYDDAIAMDPANSVAYRNRGHAEMKLDLDDDALRSYGKALRCDRGSSENWMARGRALCSLGRYSSALRCCDRAIEIEPNRADYYLNRRTALQALGRYEEAAEDYEKAIARDGA